MGLSTTTTNKNKHRLLYAKIKEADQLVHPPNLNNISIHFLKRFTCMQSINIEASPFSCAVWFESCFVGNPEDRFSGKEAYIL